MTPAEVASDWVSDLIDLLRADVASAFQQLEDAEAELGAVDGEPGRALMAFVAVAIDRAYSALETGLSRIARKLDRHVPAGADWHAGLFNQMALAIQDRRPAAPPS